MRIYKIKKDSIKKKSIGINDYFRRVFCNFLKIFVFFKFVSIISSTFSK